MQPCIKYVGGKTKLLPQISEYIPEETTHIVEPFCGSAALAFSREQPFYIFDASPELINFYKVLSHEGGYYEQLLEELSQIEADQSKGLYYEMRAWDRDIFFHEKYNEVQRAARYYYIIYGGYNGLYRVNGRNQCNTPMGDKCMTVNTERLSGCRLHLLKYCCGLACTQFDDIGSLISQIDAHNKPFVLIDPPYSDGDKEEVGDGKKGVFKAYTPEGDKGDFYKRLLNFMWDLTNAGIPFVMTNTYCGFICEYFKEFSVEKKETKYTIAADGTKRGVVYEAFVSNGELI